MAFNKIQKHDWYTTHKAVIKKRRQAKHRKTKDGYLLFIWKGYYEKAINGDLAFYIPRTEFVNYFLDNRPFNEAFNKWSLNGFRYEDTPYISKENKESKWNLGDLVVRPQSEIKIRKVADND